MSAIAAYQELDAEPLSLSITPIVNLRQLRELWAIDNEAYGDCSIEMGTFQQWWETYPAGLKAVMRDRRIVAAYGLFPLSAEQAEEFQAGRISEAQLIPSNEIEVRRGADVVWYFSGVVLRQDKRKPRDSPLRMLLATGLSSWLSRLSTFPVTICSLGFSPDGERLLKRFGFEKQAIVSPPDNCPIYRLQASSKAEAVKILKGRLAL